MFWSVIDWNTLLHINFLRSVRGTKWIEMLYVDDWKKSSGLKYSIYGNYWKSKREHVPERLSRLLFRMTSVCSFFCTVMENMGTESSRL